MLSGLMVKNLVWLLEQEKKAWTATAARCRDLAVGTLKSSLHAASIKTTSDVLAARPLDADASPNVIAGHLGKRWRAGECPLLQGLCLVPIVRLQHRFGQLGPS